MEISRLFLVQDVMNNLIVVLLEKYYMEISILTPRDKQYLQLLS